MLIISVQTEVIVGDNKKIMDENNHKHNAHSYLFPFLSPVSIFEHGAFAALQHFEYEICQ